jgi:dolichol-phosphate mannosyltransferase
MPTNRVQIEPAGAAADADTRPSPVVSIVLPTYNERENIAPLVRKLRGSLAWPMEMLIVDDNSPDGTAEIVARLARDIDEVRLILREDEKGLTGAIQRGVDEASGEVVVWMDSDFSMPPEKVRELVTCVLNGEADAAVGSRFVVNGLPEAGPRDSWPVRAQRLFTQRRNRLLTWLTGAPFHDWTSGFIAVRSPLIKKIRLHGNYGEYFIRLIAELLRRGSRIVELPYRCVPRGRGESKSASGPFGFVRLGARYLFALREARRSIRRGRSSAQ